MRTRATTKHAVGMCTLSVKGKNTTQTKAHNCTELEDTEFDYTIDGVTKTITIACPKSKWTDESGNELECTFSDDGGSSSTSSSSSSSSSILKGVLITLGVILLIGFLSWFFKRSSS